MKQNYKNFVILMIIFILIHFNALNKLLKKDWFLISIDIQYWLTYQRNWGALSKMKEVIFARSIDFGFCFFFFLINIKYYEGCYYSLVCSFYAVYGCSKTIGIICDLNPHIFVGFLICQLSLSAVPSLLLGINFFSLNCLNCKLDFRNHITSTDSKLHVYIHNWPLQPFSQDY